MKTRILSLSILLFFSLLSFSANIEWKTGYVITQEGDTIRGIIGYSGRELTGGNCLFKEMAISKEVSYTTREIKGYMFDSGLCYETLHFNNSKVQGNYFAQCLVKGILSLYYVSIELPSKETYKRYVALNETTGKMTEWIPLGDKTIKFIEVQRIQKTLEVLMQAAPGLTGDIKKVRTDEKKLIELFKRYHDLICNEYKCVLYVETKKKRSLWLTANLGGQINFIDFSGYNDQSKNAATDYSPNIGMELSLNLDRQSRHWLLNMGLNLYMVDFYKENYRVANNTHNLTFKAVNIENSFGVQYNWVNRYNFLLEAGFFQVGEIVRENDIKIFGSFQEYEMEHRKWTGGLFAGVGYEFHLKNSHSLPIKLRYKASLIGSYKFDRFIQHDVLSLSVGYRFKL